jgi:hypothetical protein
MLEIIDADWRERCHDRAVGALIRHFHGRASQRPSAPPEADDNRCENARGGSLHEAG